MIKKSIDRNSGVFTPDESDHLNVALSQINDKIKNIQTPVIDWHYDVQDILVDGAIENNSIKIGSYYQLNFSYNSDIEILHRPIATHEKRDYTIFLEEIGRRGMLSAKLRTMYA